MKMNFLLVVVLMVGCAAGGVKPVVPDRLDKANAVTVNRLEMRRLLRDCEVEQVPKDADDRPLDDVAVDLANSRKAALEKCNARLRKARSKLDD